MCAPHHGQPLTGLSGTCVCVHYTALGHLEPAPVARPVPAQAHVLVVPIIRAVTREGKPLTPGDGAFLWGSSEVRFGSPHFERAVCRPRGQLHPSPSFPVAFHPQRADPQAAASLTSSACTHPPPTNNPSPFKFSPSHRKNQPQGFVRIFRVRGELRNAKCIPLPRSSRGSKIALFRACPPQKGENAAKLKFRPQSNV